MPLIAIGCWPFVLFGATPLLHIFEEVAVVVIIYGAAA